jgi:hypothetical protein
VYLEQRELEAVAPLCADTEIRKDEKAGVLAIVLAIFEVVQTRDN